MKKSGLFIGLFLILFVGSLSNVFALPCDLRISLVNQDPDFAIPGEEVKVIFQIKGLENSECKTVEFEIIEKYPISLSPEQNSKYVIQSGIYERNYQSFFSAPYTLRVSNDALDGNNLIEVRYRYGNNVGWISKEFNLDVKDIRTDFEFHVKNYNSATRTITLEILNIGKNDAQLVIIEIPKQENIEIKGSNRNTIGDLDSKEYTTAEFEAKPKNGEIKLNVIYSDLIDERRILEKSVVYNSEYFDGLIRDEKNSPVGSYIIVLLIVALLGYYFYRRQKKKKAFREKLNRK